MNGKPPLRTPGGATVGEAAGWEPARYARSVVVMNADGSRGVDARVRAGASVPLVDDLGYGLSIASLVLVLVLVLIGGTVPAEALRRRPRPSSPDGSAWAA